MRCEKDFPNKPVEKTIEVSVSIAGRHIFSGPEDKAEESIRQSWAKNGVTV